MELLNDFLSWVWARHHNELSWYVRPFFVALAVAFWRRSWLWGLAVINAGTLLKVIWSVAFGGAAGWASLVPSVFTLAVTDAALLLAMRFLRHRKKRREDAARDAKRSHDAGATTLPRGSRT
jgi:hypothetical protein